MEGLIELLRAALGQQSMRYYLDRIDALKRGLNLDHTRNSDYYMYREKIYPDTSKLTIISPASLNDNCGLFAIMQSVGFDLPLPTLNAIALELRMRYGLGEGPLTAESLIHLFEDLFPLEDLVVVELLIDGHCIEDTETVSVIVNSTYCKFKYYKSTNFLVLINSGDAGHYYYVRKEDVRRANDEEVLAVLLHHHGVSPV
jgi:hypothetical protein